MLDPRFNSPPEHNLVRFYYETVNVKPILFILSSNVNTLNELQIIRTKLNINVKIHYLPLGNWIDEKVKELILKGTENGDWVLLENLHLVTDWLLLLEKLIEKLEPEKVHTNFRLWMSSMPVNYFPVSFLQSCQKVYSFFNDFRSLSNLQKGLNKIR